MTNSISDQEIDSLIHLLDGSGSDSEWGAAIQLRSKLGSDLPGRLLKNFDLQKKAAAKTSFLYHSIRYAKESDDAIQLGLKGLLEKSKEVRYRACMLLAYSQKREVVPELARLLDKIPVASRDDLLAAIDAISNQNPNFFVDRDHSGKITLNVQ